MTLETFAEEMKVRVQKKMGSNYQVDYNWLWENNGRRRCNLTIRRNGANISPAARLEGRFEMLGNQISDEALEKTAREIIRECSEAPVNELAIRIRDHILDYEFCKGRIFFKLVNTSMNQELLKDYSNLPFLDLSVLFYLMVGGEEISEPILVSENLRKAWGVTVDELYRQALENGPEKMSAVFTEMNQMFAFLMMLRPESLSEMLKSMPKVEQMKKGTLYCLTNQKNMYGAALILYPGVLKECAEKCKTDMILFPCSVHEVLLMSVDEDKSVDELTQIVRNSNQEAVREDEVLSDHIYRYDYRTDRLFIV